MKREPPDMPGVSISANEHKTKVPPRGVEHSSKTAEKQAVSDLRGTDSGTPADESASNRQPADPELAAVVTAWPDLSAAVKAGILAMVKVSGRG